MYIPNAMGKQIEIEIKQNRKKKQQSRFHSQKYLYEEFVF